MFPISLDENVLKKEHYEVGRFVLRRIFFGI
jgi:hypothetical protein